MYMKEDLYVIIITLVIFFGILTCFVMNAQNKRVKIQECIEQTGNELKCKCVYRDCSRDIIEAIK